MIRNIKHNQKLLIFLNPISKQFWSDLEANKAEMYCKAISPFYYFHQEQINLIQANESANKQLSDTAEIIKGFQDENPWFAEEDLKTLTLDEMVTLLLNQIETFKNSIDNNQLDASEDKPEVHHSKICRV